MLRHTVNLTLNWYFMKYTEKKISQCIFPLTILSLHCLTLSWRRPYHIETSPLICANQWTGFYMISASVMKELILHFLFLYYNDSVTMQINGLVSIWYRPQEIVDLKLYINIRSVIKRPTDSTMGTTRRQTDTLSEQTSTKNG